MEILLIQDVDSLGQRGDLVKVAKGYFRNYLNPQGLAVLATEGNRRRLDEENRVRVLRDKKHVGAAQGLAERLTGLSLKLKAQAGEEGRLYGSVTAQTIHKALEEKGHKVETRAIRLPEPIKELGEYQIELNLHREVSVTISVAVEQE